MTAHSEPALDDSLNAQLADLIAEAVVWSGEPAERAHTLMQIVSCAIDAMHWRLQPTGDPVEELSARGVLDAAAEHLIRMRR